MAFERAARFFDGLSCGLHAVMERFGNRILHRFDTPIQRFEGAAMIRFSRGEESA
jgi:hypothetical protein